jgi:hypothetical protein
MVVMNDRNDHPLVSDLNRSPLRDFKLRPSTIRTLLALAFAMLLGTAAAFFTYETVRSGRAPTHQSSSDDPGLIP